jgi:5-(carboxyamino)imidazole ribonucleotide synthase
MRAVAGWPLGSAERHSDVVMTNLIGDEVSGWLSLAAAPQTAVHIYGKAEARPGRKMGHVNRLTPRQD